AGNSYMRFTTDTTFSFKAAAVSTITINAKNPISQKKDSETGDQGTGTERTITLTGTNTNTDGIKITYSPSTDDADAVYADKEYISNSTEEDIYTLTVSNGMNIAYISVTFGDSGSSSGETTTETATETTTVAGVIYDTAQLTFSEVETISEETTLCSYFSITPSMEVVESSATVNGNTYNYLLKSGGDSGTISADNPPTKRAITFTTADAGVIQFCALPASSSNISDRTILIYDTSDYSKTVDTISFDSTAAVMTKICNLPGAGTYCIAFGGGVNIYSINVAVGRSIAADSNGNGYIFTNSSDSYAVTGVTADDAASEDYSKLTVTAVGTDGSGSAETGTVYEYATVDGFVIKPSFLGSDSEGNSYSYLYVVQIEESGGNTDFTYSSKLS
ncbi:MAG: hypothetical protein LUH47_08530, partial [Clostridiales bacterium]|nr:hypothetical protein [Clostridiales bacterium]